MWVNLFFVTVLVACAPLQKKGDGPKDPARGRQGDQKPDPVLKVAYSMDDIQSTEIIPKQVAIEPWSPVQLFLAGTLPDKTQGRIPSEVRWQVDNSDLAVIGAEQGQLIAKKEGTISVTARFRELTAEKQLSVQWRGSRERELANPEDFKAVARSDTSIALSWRFADGPITGHQIAYLEGAVAPTDCSSDTVINSEEIGDRSQLIVSDLTAATTYSFRICSVQELKTEDVSARRLSAGKSEQAKTKNP